MGISGSKCRTGRIQETIVDTTSANVHSNEGTSPPTAIGMAMLDNDVYRTRVDLTEGNYIQSCTLALYRPTVLIAIVDGLITFVFVFLPFNRSI